MAAPPYKRPDEDVSPMTRRTRAREEAQQPMPPPRRPAPRHEDDEEVENRRGLARATVVPPPRVLVYDPGTKRNKWTLLFILHLMREVLYCFRVCVCR